MKIEIEIPDADAQRLWLALERVVTMPQFALLYRETREIAIALREGLRKRLGIQA